MIDYLCVNVINHNGIDRSADYGKDIRLPVAVQ